MILTGKAKESFLKHVYFTEDTSKVNESIETEITEEASCWLSNQDERFRNAMIISWMDSFGIYIGIETEGIEEYGTAFYAYINESCIEDTYITRQQAT